MKKKFGLLTLLIAGTGIIFATGMTSEKDTVSAEKVTTIAESLNVGDTAPDFTLKNVDGSMVALSGITNDDGSAPNGYIVTFTCNTCPYAVMYEDRLIALHNEYAPQGWPVVAINPNDPDVKPGDSFNAMIERATAKEFPFVYLFDEGQTVYPQYGATKTPHVFLVDNTMTVRYIGAIDNNPQDAEAATQHYVADAIAAIGAGNDPDPDYTKAIGCGIKKKK